MIKVVHSVSIMNRAGQETFLMNVYRNIDRTKIQFDFQCSEKGKGDYDDEIRRLGGHLTYLSDNKIKIPYLSYIGHIFAQYKFFKFHGGYDVFHIHTYHAFNAWLLIVGAKAGGIKHIVLHSHNSQGMHPRLHKLFRPLLNRMHIQRYACSELAAQWMYGSKALRSGNVKIVKNGIIPEEFAFSEAKRREKRRELNVENEIVLGHIGRFGIQKNHSFLIDIFSEFVKIVPQTKLLLVGEGELRSNIQEKVNRLGLQDKVSFLGVREDIREILWAMDVFVFPSLYEGLSVVAIEAQAAGVPILAADTLSEETQITDCLHFYSLDASPHDWAERLRELCKERHLFTTEAIKKAGYDIRETAEMLANDYQNIIMRKDDM